MDVARLITQTHKHYAPINVNPYPQYRDGWGNTKGFDVKQSSKGRAFELSKMLLVLVN